MQNLADHIEYTNLKPDVSHTQIDQLIQDARDKSLLGVCVPPFWVKKAARDKGDLKLVTVVGFPIGYSMTEVKLKETELALRDGADEIDLVMNVSALKADMTWPKVEFAKISKMVHEQEKILKVIIETSLLSKEEMLTAAGWAANAGSDFVKTSTGFVGEGAKIDDIRILREALPSDVGIKASGGIKTREQAIALIEAGADRIGTSSLLY